MVSLNAFNFISSNIFFKFGVLNGSRALQIRNYSVYPPNFIEPVYHPDKIKELDEAEIRERAHKKVKPPGNNQSASVFHDPLLEKFTNHVMKGGQKALARKIIGEAFEKIKRSQIRKFHLAKDPEKQKNISTNPLEIFHKAVENCKPVLDVTPVKRGGVMYKVPVSITDIRATYLALTWLVDSAREHEPRRNHTGEYFSDRLAQELLSACDHSGKTYKKKVELHRVCENNKAYAHYRWT